MACALAVVSFESLAPWKDYSEKIICPTGQGLVGTVMQKQNSVWMTRVDNASPESFARAPGAKAWGINTAFGLPVPAAVIDPAADPPFAAICFYSLQIMGPSADMCNLLISAFRGFATDGPLLYERETSDVGTQTSTSESLDEDFSSPTSVSTSLGISRSSSSSISSINHPTYSSAGSVDMLLKAASSASEYKMESVVPHALSPSVHPAYANPVKVLHSHDGLPIVIVSFPYTYAPDDYMSHYLAHYDANYLPAHGHPIYVPQYPSVNAPGTPYNAYIATPGESTAPPPSLSREAVSMHAHHATPGLVPFPPNEALQHTLKNLAVDRTSGHPLPRTNGEQNSTPPVSSSPSSEPAAISPAVLDCQRFLPTDVLQRALDDLSSSRTQCSKRRRTDEPSHDCEEAPESAESPGDRTIDLT